ncbi:signal peptidase I [Sphingomonas sp. ID0503]|uniref:signal peptidase I n=1 Tax=Sphingomonas sp. ID0503 TaxID=3399691 RepID=UPI003AFAB54C
MTAEPSDIPAPRTDWLAEARSILVLLLIVIGFHSLVAKPFYIPSESMMPTLLKGDRLVVSKYPYGWSWVSPSFHVLPPLKGRLFGRVPERGDVVIAVPPGETSDYIKRVMALPGDRIALRGGVVYLNGVAVKRQAMPDRLIPIDANVPCDQPQVADRRIVGPDGRLYCSLPIYRETLPNGRSYDTIDLGEFEQVDEFPEITVPEDRIFLMGDNRDQSADSRVSSADRGLGGPIPLENIGGRAEFITFSLNGGWKWSDPKSWIDAFRSGRAGTSLHPAEAAR